MHIFMHFSFQSTKDILTLESDYFEIGLFDDGFTCKVEKTIIITTDPITRL